MEKISASTLKLVWKMPKKDPCKKYACEIQKCLNSKDFQEGKCQEEIERLKECCRTWGKESICCSGFPELWPSPASQERDKGKGATACSAS